MPLFLKSSTDKQVFLFDFYMYDVASLLQEVTWRLIIFLRVILLKTWILAKCQWKFQMYHVSPFLLFVAHTLQLTEYFCMHSPPVSFNLCLLKSTDNLQVGSFLDLLCAGWWPQSSFSRSQFLSLSGANFLLSHKWSSYIQLKWKVSIFHIRLTSHFPALADTNSFCTVKSGYYIHFSFILPALQGNAIVPKCGPNFLQTFTFPQKISKCPGTNGGSVLNCQKQLRA